MNLLTYLTHFTYLSLLHSSHPSPPPPLHYIPSHSQAYINRLQERQGFFMQPDTISVDELVILLRTGCKQVVELNNTLGGLTSAASSRRG